MSVGVTTSFMLGLLGLRSHILRTILSTLGIICGVAAVVVSVNISESARQKQLDDLAALGSDLIKVNSIPYTDGNDKKIKKKFRLISNGLNLQTVEFLKGRLQTELTDAVPMRNCLLSSGRVAEKTLQAQIVATTPEYIRVRRFEMKTGRFLSKIDDHDRARVCVLESAVAHEAFPSQNPVGATVYIDHEPYTVIGVITEKTVTDEKYQKMNPSAVNTVIYIPLETAMERLTRDPLADEIDEVLFQAGPKMDLMAVAQKVKYLLEVTHGMVNAKEEDQDFRVTVPVQMYQQTKETERTWDRILLIFGLVALVVGGIGIMNIMLANVTERRREVGIRRALGATQIDILLQFLMESVLVCVNGGLLGCFIGVAGTFIYVYSIGWSAQISWSGMIIAIFTSSIVGLVFGVYPAWSASKVDPIEALRYE
ncbi:MAG TPA: ABC transporter permease [Planctomycetota bacterium]|nr:ABC transporter permease [Planctomycetota bacterium]